MARNEPIVVGRPCHTPASRIGSDRAPATVFLHRKINLNEIKEEPWQSPGGKYAVSFKGISEALGPNRSSLDLSKRHPFDLEWNRVPTGKQAFSLSRAFGAMELYLVVSGKGSIRHRASETEVVPGDAFIFRPDKPHQLSNPGPGRPPFYYVIADNPIGDQLSTQIAGSGR